MGFHNTGNHFIRSCGLANRFVKAIQETDFTINYPLTKHTLFWDFYARQNGSLLPTFRGNLLTPHAAQKSLQSMTLQKKVIHSTNSTAVFVIYMILTPEIHVNDIKKNPVSTSKNILRTYYKYQ